MKIRPTLLSLFLCTASFTILLRACFGARELKEHEIEAVVAAAREMALTMSTESSPFRIYEEAGYQAYVNNEMTMYLAQQRESPDEEPVLFEIDDAFYESEHYAQIMQRANTGLTFAKACLESDGEFIQIRGAESLTYLLRELTDEELATFPRFVSDEWVRGTVNIGYSTELTFQWMRIYLWTAELGYVNYTFYAPNAVEGTVIAS